MKTIKFNDTSYELVYDVIKESSRIRITIYKNDLSLADVASVVTDVNQIQVLEDDEVIAIFNGYTFPVALNIYNDYPFSAEAFGSVISIELENTDMQSQIDAINNQIDIIVSVQESQEAQLDGKLNASVLGDEETIGEPSKNNYKVDETFIGSDGKYYKVIVPIITGTILVVGGNCEETSISEELNLIQ